MACSDEPELKRAKLSCEEKADDNCGSDDEREEFSRPEEDVGIQYFVSDNTQFDGILKQNWEDFHVHEVDEHMKQVKLTSLSCPIKVRETFDNSVLTTDERKKLLIVLNADYNKEEAVINVDNLDKNGRTQLHKSIKSEFPDLCSNTSERNGQKVVIVTKNKPSKGWHKGQDRGDGLPGKFCHFVLFKEGKSTAEAISSIARQLRMKPNYFTFSGTKDKRAVTSQLACCSKITAEKLKSASDTLRSIKLGNFEYKNTCLQLGNNWGNDFTMVIRNVNKSLSKNIEENISNIRIKGFINYFGLQRFGSTSLATHTVGKALLKSKWSDAIDMLLEPLKDDRPFIRKWKEDYKNTGNHDAALKVSKTSNLERQLILAVSHYGKTLDALLQLPRNSIQLYIHAYQSYIWNIAVSKRIELFGFKPQVGDLVVVNETVKGKEAVHVLNEKDIDSTSFSNIVMPLPGFDIAYPNNTLKKVYTDVLKADGLDESCFKHKVRLFAMPGSYRNILCIPANISFYWKSYLNEAIGLIQSDKCEMENQVILAEDIIDEDNLKMALIIDLRLPKSSYATMAIRELSHGKISVAHRR